MGSERSRSSPPASTAPRGAGPVPRPPAPAPRVPHRAALPGLRRFSAPQPSGTEPGSSWCSAWPARALLIAAPVALFLARAGAPFGSSRDPEGVFTGDPDLRGWRRRYQGRFGDPRRVAHGVRRSPPDFFTRLVAAGSTRSRPGCRTSAAPPVLRPAPRRPEVRRPEVRRPGWRPTGGGTKAALPGTGTKWTGSQAPPRPPVRSRLRPAAAAASPGTPSARRDDAGHLPRRGTPARMARNPAAGPSPAVARDPGGSHGPVAAEDCLCEVLDPVTGTVGRRRRRRRRAGGRPARPVSAGSRHRTAPVVQAHERPRRRLRDLRQLRLGRRSRTSTSPTSPTTGPSTRASSASPSTAPRCATPSARRGVDELITALEHARLSTDVGCVILTGNGPSPKDGGWAFCSAVTSGCAGSTATSTRPVRAAGYTSWRRSG